MLFFKITIVLHYVAEVLFASLWIYIFLNCEYTVVKNTVIINKFDVTDLIYARALAVISIIVFAPSEKMLAQ